MGRKRKMNVAAIATTENIPGKKNEEKSLTKVGKQNTFQLRVRTAPPRLAGSSNPENVIRAKVKLRNRSMKAQASSKFKKTNKYSSISKNNVTKESLIISNVNTPSLVFDKSNNSSPAVNSTSIKASNKENATSFPDLFTMLCQQRNDAVILFSSDGWECKKCNHIERLSMDSLSKLRHHLLQHHGTDTEGLKRQGTSENVSQLGCTGQQKCPHCGLLRKNLGKHVEKFHSSSSGCQQSAVYPRHKGYKYRCHYLGCSASYALKQGLASHIASKHNEKKQFSCSICHRHFPDEASLSEHITQSHLETSTATPTPTSANAKSGTSQPVKRARPMLSSEGPKQKTAILDADGKLCSKDKKDDIKSFVRQKHREKSDRDVKTEVNETQSSHFNSESFDAGTDDVVVKVHFEPTEAKLQLVKPTDKKADNSGKEMADTSETGLRRSSRKVKLKKYSSQTDGQGESKNGEDDDGNDYDVDDDYAEDEGGVDPNEEGGDSSKGRKCKLKKTGNDMSDASKSSFANSEITSGHARKSASFAKRIPIAFDLFASVYRKEVVIPLLSCEVCNHPFLDESSRESHVKHYEGQQIVNCSLCDKMFHNSDVLNVHIMFDHDNTSTTSSCYHCPNVTKSKRSMVKHMVKCHAASKGLTPEILHLDSLTTQQCEVCKIHLLCDPQLIALHHKAHKRAAKPQKQVQQVARAFAKAKRVNKDGPSGTKCCTCDRVFKNKYLAFFHTWFDHNSDDLPFQGAAMLDQESRNHILQMVEEEQVSKNELASGKDKVSFWCGVCGTVLNDGRMEIIKHLGVHHNRLFASSETYLNKKQGLMEDRRVRMMYQCLQCKEEVPDIRNRVGFHHLTHGHINDTNRHLKCRYCPAFFFCVSRVKRHERTKHAIHTGDFTGMCDTCGSHFTSQRAMEEHMKLHNQTLINCEVCNRGFKTQGALEKHRVKHDQDQYCCPHCGEQYMGKNSLNKHIKREHEKVHDPRYKCKMCPAFFSDVIEIRDHIATKHEGRNPYPCTLCTETFGTRPTLMRHMRREHEGLSPFVCEKCGQAFHEKYILQRHMTTHGAPDPFLCPICSKSLRNQLAVQKHIRKVHKETLSFACEKCNLRFSNHEELTKHHKRYCSFKRKEKKVPATSNSGAESNANVSGTENVTWSTLFEMNSAEATDILLS